MKIGSRLKIKIEVTTNVFWNPCLSQTSLDIRAKIVSKLQDICDAEVEMHHELLDRLKSLKI